MDSNRITEALERAVDSRTNQADQKAIIDMLLVPLEDSSEKMREFLSRFFFYILENDPERVIPIVLPLFVFLHQK